MLGAHPLWDKILSFLHTFLLKSTHVGGPCPPYGSTPPRTGPCPPMGNPGSTTDSCNLLVFRVYNERPMVIDSLNLKLWQIVRFSSNVILDEMSSAKCYLLFGKFFRLLNTNNTMYKWELLVFYVSCSTYTIIDVCIDICVMMSSDLHGPGTCSSTDVIVMP